MFTIRRGTAALVGAAAITLAACGTASPTTSETAGSTAATVEIEDNNGTLTVPTPPKTVVATDNRTFETLTSWGITLAAAPVGLMPDAISSTLDTSVVDLGTHGEPKLEAMVALEPDVIVNGQRFTQFHDDFARLVPDAKIISLDPREGQPFDAELKRQVSVLGEVFGKQAEATKLTADFDAAIARVKAAYQSDQKVMAVNTSGGDIGFIAPGVGRTLGPLFTLFGFTPALEVPDGSSDHQGDDISVEAIAKSNPDWILVMDRDAAISADDPTFKPANEILEKSAALKNVTAVKEGNIVYMPADTYLNEGIQTYTEFLNTLADALEGKG